MRYLVVKKSKPLSGTVRIQGSKNSTLGLISAACLADSPIYLKGIPKIRDISILSDLAKDIGLKIEFDTDNNLLIDPRHIHSNNLLNKVAREIRTSYYFIGVLLDKFGAVKVGYPGGDDFGQRPIDQHVKGFQALGAEFVFKKDMYIVSAEKLFGTEIFFDVKSSGATINLLIASCKAEGETVLKNCATDPEVVDVANFLNMMGANITGAGTDTIKIQGVNKLKGNIEYKVIPDRLIAGTLLMAAGVTAGSIRITNVIPEHLRSCISKLEEIGMSFSYGNNTIVADGSRIIKANRIKTGMYPNFATDLQQPLTALLLKAKGKSIVTDTVYPNRFAHVKALNKLGANITVKGNSAFIIGDNDLIGSYVQATDVRAGSCLILAGLIAEGKTFISGIQHIERGFEDVVGIFNNLGANISILEVVEEDVKEKESG